MIGKIAIEEHFNLPEFSVPQYVNAETMREISRRLLNVSAMRLAEDPLRRGALIPEGSARGHLGQPECARRQDRARA